MDNVEKLKYVRQLLSLVKEHKKLLKKSLGLCKFISELYEQDYISEDDKLNIKTVILSPSINPKHHIYNRLGVRFSFKERYNYSIYWFKPGCIWRRRLWLKRLIKKLKKDVK